MKMDTSSYIYEGNVQTITDFQQIKYKDETYSIRKSKDELGNKSILIYHFDEVLSFMIRDFNLYLYGYDDENDNMLASKLLLTRIKHMFTQKILNLDLLIPYFPIVYSIYNDTKMRVIELLKQGKRTKRAN